MLNRDVIGPYRCCMHDDTVIVDRQMFIKLSVTGVYIPRRNQLLIQQQRLSLVARQTRKLKRYRNTREESRVHKDSRNASRQVCNGEELRTYENNTLYLCCLLEDYHVVAVKCHQVLFKGYFTLIVAFTGATHAPKFFLLIYLFKITF